VGRQRTLPAGGTTSPPHVGGGVGRAPAPAGGTGGHWVCGAGGTPWVNGIVTWFETGSSGGTPDVPGTGGFHPTAARQTAYAQLFDDYVTGEVTMGMERAGTAGSDQRMGSGVFALLVIQVVCTPVALGVLGVALTAGTWWGQTITSAQRLTVWRDVTIVVACLTILPVAVLAMCRRWRGLRIEGVLTILLVLMLFLARTVLHGSA
jgi:hypothetical protein